jgi:ferritin-like metal-binding protein YciE
MEIRDLLIREMQDLYDAEKQLVKALPKMAKAASNSDLRQAFTEHAEVTKNQVQRLEQAFQMLGAKAKARPCAAMKGLVTEAQEIMAEDLSEPMLDSAMIGAAQKVEHYEIAGYGTLCAWANALGLKDVSELLEETLDEEKSTDERLTEVNEPILTEMASGQADEEAEEEEAPAPAKRSRGKTQAAGSGRRAAG